MLDWLIPSSLFWIVAAVYLGALSVLLVGGTGARQVLGLVLTFVLYLALWGVVRWVLGRIGEGFILQTLLPTVIVLAAFPLLVRAGFGALGVRVERARAPVH